MLNSSILAGRLSRAARLALPLCAVLALTLGLAHPAFAQSVSLNLGQGSVSGRVIQLLLLVTVLSVAPGILLTVTSFTRFVIVLSLLRSALGTQQAPPNAIMISLAMFLSFFVMAPTFEAAWTQGVKPLIAEQIDEEQAFDRTAQPFRLFMLKHVRESDLNMFVTMSKKPVAKPDETPMTVLMPAFMVSELRRAFEIGFLLYLPFVIIDLVVASILMAMGMMMLPPITISLPFKLIFFVLVDGWALVAGSLVRSFTG